MGLAMNRVTTTQPDQKLGGGLYFVATPIGNARDITLRALDILRDADVLAAEDTRSLRRLMEIHGISLGERALLAYHDHNAPRVRPRLLEALAQGKSVAYASEAGMPMIADPGFDLGRAAREEGALVTVAPGASAVLSALCVAALPTDRFLFSGFLPSSRGARRKALEELAEIRATIAFYESPRRLAAMLQDAAELLGDAREGAVCRELTKKFEEVRRAPLADLAQYYAHTPAKGEVVVLIEGGSKGNVKECDVEEALKAALGGGASVRDAAHLVAQASGMRKREVYQMALEMENAQQEEQEQEQ